MSKQAINAIFGYTRVMVKLPLKPDQKVRGKKMYVKFAIFLRSKSNQSHGLSSTTKLKAFAGRHID